jgi:hypothetical protein
VPDASVDKGLAGPGPLAHVAVGRKNWLFAGGDEGAERACVIYSLLATCKLHGVNSFKLPEGRARSRRQSSRT